MADAGFAAQDAGAFRRRDRSHRAEKRGVVRRSIVATERPDTSLGLPTVRHDGSGAHRKRAESLRRFTSGRDPSTPDCQRAFIDEAKANRCVSLLRELAEARSAPRRQSGAGASPRGQSPAPKPRRR
jgi:hypothetical protein